MHAYALAFFLGLCPAQDQAGNAAPPAAAEQPQGVLAFGMVRRGESVKRTIALQGVEGEVQVTCLRRTGAGQASAVVERASAPADSVHVTVTLKAPEECSTGSTMGDIRIMSGDRMLCSIPYQAMLLAQPTQPRPSGSGALAPDMTVRVQQSEGSAFSPEQVRVILQDAYPLLYLSPQQAAELAVDMRADGALRAAIKDAQQRYEQRLAAKYQRLLAQLRQQGGDEASRRGPGAPPAERMSREEQLALIKLQAGFSVAFVRAEAEARSQLFQELLPLGGEAVDAGALHIRLQTRALEGSVQAGQQGADFVHMSLHAPLLALLRNECAPGGTLELVGPGLLELDTPHQDNSMLREARAALGLYEQALSSAIDEWMKSTLQMGDEMLAAHAAGDPHPLAGAGLGRDHAVRSVGGARWKCAEALAALLRSGGPPDPADALLQKVRVCMCPVLFNATAADALVAEAQQVGLAEQAAAFLAARESIREQAFIHALNETGASPDRSAWWLNPSGSRFAASLRQIEQLEKGFTKEIEARRAKP